MLDQRLRVIVSVGLLAAWLDTLAGGIQASDETELDQAIIVASLFVYLAAIGLLWWREKYGRFAAAWLFAFNALLGVVFTVDFLVNIGASAEVVEVLRSILMSSLFLWIIWLWEGASDD